MRWRSSGLRLAEVAPDSTRCAQTRGGVMASESLERMNAEMTLQHSRRFLVIEPGLVPDAESRPV